MKRPFIRTILYYVSFTVLAHFVCKSFSSRLTSLNIFIVIETEAIQLSTTLLNECYSNSISEPEENLEIEKEEEVHMIASSPASVASSQLSDFKETCLRVEEAEMAKRRAEELTNSAAALAEFITHISDILRRIGELDMLKVATSMQALTSKTLKHKSGDVAAGENEESEDRTPPEARLSRREISALYQESAQVRVAGSISNVRTGHLVRLLTVLLVNIRDASSLVAPHPTPVCNTFDLLNSKQICMP